jgi:ketosteroid isomerase-like protein
MGGRTMKAAAKTEAEVMDVVRLCFEAFARRDLDGFSSFFAPDPNIVLIGTGRDEKCIGLAEIKAIIGRSFTQFEDANFEFGWRSVSVADSVAWLAADVILNVKTSSRELCEPLRLTGVMEKRGDRWFIVQVHDSLPAAGQKEGEAFSA